MRNVALFSIFSGRRRVGLYVDTLNGYPLHEALQANADRVGEERSISFLAVTLPQSVNAAAPTQAIVAIARRHGLDVHYYWPLPETGGIPDHARAGNDIIPLLRALNESSGRRLDDGGSDVLCIDFLSSHIVHGNSAALLLELAKGLDRRFNIRIGLRSDNGGFAALPRNLPLDVNTTPRMELCRVEPMGSMNGVNNAREVVDARLAALRALHRALLPGLGGDCYWEMENWLYLPGIGNGNARVRLVFAD